MVRFVLVIFAVIASYATGLAKPELNLGVAFRLLPSNRDHHQTSYVANPDFSYVSSDYIPESAVVSDYVPVPSESSSSPLVTRLSEMGSYLKSSLSNGMQSLRNLITPSFLTSFNNQQIGPASSLSSAELASLVASSSGGSIMSEGTASIPSSVATSQTFIPSPVMNLPDKKKRKTEGKVKPAVTEEPSPSLDLLRQQEVQLAFRSPEQGNALIAPSATDIDRRPIVFFDLTVDNIPAGTLFIELFNETVPRTCENFRALVTGEYGFGYKGSVFHRIIPGFVVQGGDIIHSDGTGQRSIYGHLFPDENFLVPHDSPGLVSMANSGPDTNGSQFFITLSKMKKLNGKHVVFGRIYDQTSYDLLESINRKFGSLDGVPQATVQIVNSGQYR